MKRQNRDKTRRESLARVYFEYWRLQNNPDYREFWRELSGMDEETRRSKTVYEPPLLRNETVEKWLKRMIASGGKGQVKNWLISRCKDFELNEPVDPTFQINWNTIFDRETNHSFILTFYKAWTPKGPVEIRLGDPEEPTGNYFSLFVDHTQDKKDFLKAAARAFDQYRKIIGFKPTTRDHWVKVPLYCRAWETVMTAPPKSLDAARLELKTSKMTVYKRLRRAYELLTGAPYTPEGRQEILIEKMEEFDRTLTLCDKCKNKVCERTKTLCRKMEDYLKRNIEVFFAGKTMEDFDAYSDHKTFLDWQTKE